MKKQGIFINGVSLPFHVIDKGLEQARLGNAIKCALIYQNNDDTDSYVIPSDIALTKADFTDQTAEIHLTELMAHHEEFVRSYFSQRDLEIETTVLINPAIEDIVAAFEDVEKIFFDPETFRRPDESAYVNIAYEQFEEHLSSKLESVAAV